jgi:hypothetical protein
MASPLGPLVREWTPGLHVLLYDPSVPANDQVEKAPLDEQAGARFVEAIELAIPGATAILGGGTLPGGTPTTTGSASLNVSTIFGATAANGATAYSAEIGGVPVRGWSFSNTVDQGISAAFLMPHAWDGGTLFFEFGWSHLATTLNFGVTWEISAACLADGADLAAVFGTPVLVSDTGGDANKTYTSVPSASVTVGGTPAGGNKLILKIIRRQSDGADTLAVNAALTGLIMNFGTGPAVSGSGVFPFTFPFILG